MYWAVHSVEDMTVTTPANGLGLVEAGGERFLGEECLERDKMWRQAGPKRCNLAHAFLNAAIKG